MKKAAFFKVFLCLLLFTALCACTPDDPTEGDFDVTHLYGKWCQEGTKIYYKYNDDGTGATWDESDDVYEDEAQAFTWEVDGSEMIHIHLTETGTAQIPKYYIITFPQLQLQAGVGVTVCQLL